MKKKQVSVKRILGKLLLLLLIFLIWSVAARKVLRTAAAFSDFLYNKADKIQSCDYYYNKKNYGGLREDLAMYRLTGEEFGKYWEMAEGFEDFQQYLQYKKAAQAGVSGAAEKAEQYRFRVIGNAENCENSENRKQLEEYARQCGEPVKQKNLFVS